MERVQPTKEGDSAVTIPSTLSQTEAAQSTSTAKKRERSNEHDMPAERGKSPEDAAEEPHTTPRPDAASAHDISSLKTDVAKGKARSESIDRHDRSVFDYHWDTFEMPETRFEDDWVVIQTHRWELLGDLWELRTGRSHREYVHEAVQEDIWSWAEQVKNVMF